MKFGPVQVVRCWTGRLWVNIGRGILAVGFPSKGYGMRATIARRWHFGR